MLLLLLEARCSKLLSVEGRTLLYISKALLPKADLLIWSAPGLRQNPEQFPSTYLHHNIFSPMM
jgi:hypothetical protein